MTYARPLRCRRCLVETSALLSLAASAFAVMMIPDLYASGGGLPAIAVVAGFAAMIGDVDRVVESMICAIEDGHQWSVGSNEGRCLASGCDVTALPDRA